MGSVAGAVPGAGRAWARRTADRGTLSGELWREDDEGTLRSQGRVPSPSWLVRAGVA